MCAGGYQDEYVVHACLTQKKIPTCVVLVWPFGDGCFEEWVYNLFYKLPTLSTLFHFVDLSSFGNGCSMKHIQRFEGLV